MSREINLEVICLAWGVFKAIGLDEITEGTIKLRGEVEGLKVSTEKDYQRL